MNKHTLVVERLTERRELLFRPAPDSGFGIVPLPGQLRCLEAQAGAGRHLPCVPVREAGISAPQFTRQRVDKPDNFLIPAFGLSQISGFRWKNAGTILDDGRAMGKSHGLTQRRDLGCGLAGSQDEHAIPRTQRLQRRTRRCEFIGLMVEQRTIQVAEHDEARPDDHETVCRLEIQRV